MVRQTLHSGPCCLHVKLVSYKVLAALRQSGRCSSLIQPEGGHPLFTRTNEMWEQIVKKRSSYLLFSSLLLFRPSANRTDSFKWWIWSDEVLLLRCFLLRKPSDPGSDWPWCSPHRWSCCARGGRAAARLKTYFYIKSLKKLKKM